MRLAVVLLVPFLLSGIDQDLPSPAPAVRGVFPRGAERGKSTVIEMTGVNLEDTRAVEFAGRGVRAEIEDALPGSLRLRVTVEADAETGQRDFRLRTGRGVYVGVFDIGGLPEIREAENNDDWRKPQTIALPALVNGVIAAEDWDHFKFHAKANETLVFDVGATRHGARLDADLALLDLKGHEIAWVDDSTIFGDPHLVYRFTEEGDYIARVGSLGGGPNAEYRFSVGALPDVQRALPSGMQAGRTTTVTLTGSHLDLADEVWLGDRAARARIVRKAAGVLEARFEVPANVAPGAYRVHAASKGMEMPVAFEMRVSDLPEVTVTKAPLSAAEAMPVSLSAVANGAIEQEGASHYFRFEAKAGETFLFHAESMKLGYHLDPTLKVVDGDGKSLAYADDPGVDDRADEYQLDPDLSFKAEKAGTYYVAIRDGMYRGGPLLVYRLTCERKAPDFIVELRDPVKTLYQGQKDTVQVRVRRRAGWDTPVEVWAEGLSGGVTVARQTAAPKDTVVKDTCGVDRTLDGTIVLLPVEIGDGASGQLPLRIRARGTVNGRTVEHEAIVRYQHNAANLIYGPMQVQKAELTVARPPAVVLTAADRVAVKAGEAAKVKVAVKRFGAAKSAELVVRARNVPAGVAMAPQTVAVGAKEAVLSVQAPAGFGKGRVILEAAPASGGAALGETLIEVTGK